MARNEAIYKLYKLAEIDFVKRRDFVLLIVLCRGGFVPRHDEV
nr:hypothetical protein [Mucilaginibacter sp. X4EP1]